MSFYVVAKGSNPGIYTNWLACKEQVDNYSNSLHKKFNNLEDAREYYLNNKSTTLPNKIKHQKSQSIDTFFKGTQLNKTTDLFDTFFKNPSNETTLSNKTIQPQVIDKHENLTTTTKESKITKTNFIQQSETHNGKNFLFANPQKNNTTPDSTYLAVYTDGSCINNSKKNARAGIGIYFGENDSRNVSREILTGKKTNNTAELTAIIEVFTILDDIIKQDKKINIYSDSEYSIKCCKSFGKKQYMDNWKNDIPNLDLVKTIYNLFLKHKNVEIIHVRAHTGKSDKHSLGNEKADMLANLAIGGNINKVKKIYLNVPFHDKDSAKKMGSKWDASKKKWYIMDDYIHKDNILSKFKQF